MDKKLLLGFRPPLPKEYRQKVLEITAKLNEDALVNLTGHDVLLLVVDRAYTKMFPEKQGDVKRKKYIKIDF